jgi:hypothetical protein
MPICSISLEMASKAFWTVIKVLWRYHIFDFSGLIWQVLLKCLDCRSPNRTLYHRYRVTPLRLIHPAISRQPDTIQPYVRCKNGESKCRVLWHPNRNLLHAPWGMTIHLAEWTVKWNPWNSVTQCIVNGEHMTLKRMMLSTRTKSRKVLVFEKQRKRGPLDTE